MWWRIRFAFFESILGPAVYHAQSTLSVSHLFSVVVMAIRYDTRCYIIYCIYVHKVDAQGINIKWRALPQARLAMGPASCS